MPRRRPRKLTAEDRALWDQVATTLTPLDRRFPRPLPIPPRAQPGSDERALPEPVPAAPKPTRVVKPEPRPGREPTVRFDPAPDPMAEALGAPPRMDARAYTKLRRGKLQPEARLDLHGLTADRAHGELRAFLASAHARGLRLVLVITGKGRDAGPDEGLHRRGILRTALPHWLSQPPLRQMVLQVTPAHRRHGGGGAWYVYLRRPR